MRDKDFDIKNPKKKFQKTERVPPEGYESANDFFEDMYMDKDMIWMGQNTNHLHDDTIADAMIEAIKEKTFCRYPAPEGFSELKQLILDDLDFKDLEVLLTSGATESLYLCMQALLEPEDNVILSDPGYFIIGDFANRFAAEVRYVPIYFEENDYKLTPKLLRENMDENTRMVILIDPLNPLGSSYTEDELKEFADAVVDRFNNPFIKHALLAISLNSVSKWKARCLPSFLGYVEKFGKLPEHLTFSIAALMAFYTGTEIRDGALIGHRGEQEYLVKDDADVLEFFAANSSKETAEFVQAYLSNEAFFGRDMTQIEGLSEKMNEYLNAIRKEGMEAALKHFFG